MLKRSSVFSSVKELDVNKKGIPSQLALKPHKSERRHDKAMKLQMKNHLLVRGSTKLINFDQEDKKTEFTRTLVTSMPNRGIYITILKIFNFSLSR